MAIVLPTPRQGRLGGGDLLVKALQSGAFGWAAPSMTSWWGYKLKVDSRHAGYWDYNRTTALAAATSQTITLGTTFEGTPFPTNVIIKKCLVNLIEEFAGGDIASFAIDVGDAGTVDEWFDGLDVFTGAGTGWKQDDDEADSAIPGGVVETAYAPLVTIASGTGDVAELTAGELDLWFEIQHLPATLPAYQP